MRRFSTPLSNGRSDVSPLSTLRSPKSYHFGNRGREGSCRRSLEHHVAPGGFEISGAQANGGSDLYDRRHLFPSSSRCHFVVPKAHPTTATFRIVELPQTSSSAPLGDLIPRFTTVGNGQENQT